MHLDFWHQRWQNRQIGFHLPEANPLLTTHFHTLALQPGQRVFVPLCGKTLDIHWLLAQGLQVAGIELNALAVDELFAELGLTPEIRQAGALRHYHAPDIDIFQGDFFALEAAILGKVEAVYDRAALIALPSEMRQRYSQHLIQVTHAAPQLLISFHYDQSLVQGPPFNVDASELTALYDQHYEISLLADNHLPTGLKGQHPAQEKVWRLTPLK